MISYKLAKQLKDAGFPTIQLTDHELCDYQQSEIIDGVCYHIPNLSELIEACGDDFQGIMFYPSEPETRKFRAFDWKENSFSCFDSNGNGSDIKGKTPEEAVAKLWLKLQA